MENIINIALGRTDVVVLKGVEYKVNEAAKNMCKKLYSFYLICIGIICAVGFNLAPLTGSASLLSDVLFVAVLLLIFNGFMTWASNKLLLRKIV